VDIVFRQAPYNRVVLQRALSRIKIKFPAFQWFFEKQFWKGQLSIFRNRKWLSKALMEALQQQFWRPMRTLFV
jgi:hypothetical protein